MFIEKLLSDYRIFYAKSLVKQDFASLLCCNYQNLIHTVLRQLKCAIIGLNATKEGDL